MRRVVSVIGVLVLASAAWGADPAPARNGAAFPAPADVASAKINHEALEKVGWKLSCQAYTFRGLSCYETIDVLHALGVRYVELYPGQRLKKDGPARVGVDLPQEEIDALLTKLKAANITPVNFGVVSVGGDEAAARKVFEFAKKMGLMTIVAEPDEGMFGTLDKLANEYKINVAVHDHPKPSHYWNPDTVLKVVAERSPRIGACADTGHWYRSGLVPVDCLKKLEGRIISMHFKDLSAEKRDVPWGTGLCDAKGMLAEIRRQGVKPVISIEYESTTGKELVDNVRKCAEYLSAVAEEYAKP